MARKDTYKAKVFDLLIECLENMGGEAKYSDIVNCIKSKLRIKDSSLTFYLQEIRTKIDKGIITDIEHPARGIYRLKQRNFETPLQSSITLKEEDFYQSLAEFLVNDLEECTKAIPLGGSVFRDKWGTPDVIGIYKLPDYTPLKPPPEIVSCELKLNVNQLIIAFGQACSYKLFSHKVYLVIPKISDEEEKGRIESLCLKFGIGLILFNSQDKNNPQYEIRTRAIKGDPDYYYLNLYINRLPEDLKQELFS